MKCTTYQNKRNDCKFITVKHTNDRHYMWRQVMAFHNGVVNSVGPSRFTRVHLATVKEVLSDYKEVYAWNA